MTKKLGSVALIAFMLLLSASVGLFFTQTYAFAESNSVGLEAFGIEDQAVRASGSVYGETDSLGNKRIEFSVKPLKTYNAGQASYVDMYFACGDIDSGMNWYGVLLQINANGLVRLFNNTDGNTLFIAQNNLGGNMLGEELKITVDLDISDNGGESTVNMSVYINGLKIVSTDSPSAGYNEGFEKIGDRGGNGLFVYCTNIGVSLWSQTEPTVTESWLVTDAVTSTAGYAEHKDSVENIEDFMSSVSYMTLRSGAVKDDDGNILFKNSDGRDGLTPNVTFRARTADGKFASGGGIKFKATNNSVAVADATDGKNLYMGDDETVKQDVGIKTLVEFASAETGAFWSGSRCYSIMFIFDPTAWNTAYLSDGVCRMVFYPDGISSGAVAGGAQIVEFKFEDYKDFLPTGKNYTVECGTRLWTDASKKTDAFTVWMQITNNSGNTIYGQTTYYGDFIYDNARSGGYIRICQSGDAQISPFTVMPINPARNIYENYSPEYTESPVIKNHDMADYLPLKASGVTWTVSGGESKDIINTSGFIVDTYNDCIMRFSGDYSLVLAFFTDRYNNINAVSGYQVVFEPNSVTVRSWANGKSIASETAEYAMPQDTDVHVSFRFARMYTSGIFEALKMTVYIDGDKTVEGVFDKQDFAILPNNFDGILSGNGSVSMYPYRKSAAGNNIEIEINSKNGVIEIGKNVRLDCTSEKPTFDETVEYRIVSGSDCAQIIYNERTDYWYVSGVKDGVCEVVAVVSNEFGEFESDALKITVGEGAADSGNALKGWAIALIVAGAVLVCGAAAAAAIIITKKNKEKK